MLLRGMAHEGAHAFLSEYTERSPFVGREAEFARLMRLPGGASALLCAPAGRGKSALLARLALRLEAGGARVAWAPISLRFGTHRSAIVDELLTARLRVLLGAEGHFRESIEQHEGEPLWVLIDGLDELQDEALLGTLAGLSLPASVRLVLAARTALDRGADAWAARLRLGPHERIDLGPLSFDEVAQVSGLAQVDEMMRRTGGDPLLVRLCKEALDRGEPLPDVDDPAELVGAWWAEQRARLSAPQGEFSGRALAALAAACGAVPWATLAEATDTDEATLRRAFAPFERFVIEVDGCVAFAHPRFAEVCWWTMAKAVQQAQVRLAAMAVESRKSSDPEPYFMHFSLAHLQAAAAPDEAIHGLISLASLAAWCRLEGAAGFLPELRASFALAERAVHQAWGSEAAQAPLRQQSRCLALEELVWLQESSMSGALRAALLSHGLCSAQATLAALRELGSQRPLHSSDFEPSLPFLPDAAMPALAELFIDEWSLGVFLVELLRRGMRGLALSLMLERPGDAADAMPCVAHALTAGELARVLAAFFASEKVTSSRRLSLAPLLGPHGWDVVRKIEDSWGEHPIRYARLAEAYLALGDASGALTQAERAIELCLQHPSHGPGIHALIERLIPLTSHCEGDLRERLDRLLDRLEMKWHEIGSAELLLASCPWREPPAGLLDRIDQTPWLFLQTRQLSPVLRERCEVACLRLLRTSCLRWCDAVWRAVARSPIQDRRALLELEPDFSGAHQVELNSVAWAVVAHGDEDPELARTRLFDLRARGAALWEAPGWERFFSKQERVEMLRARLLAPIRTPSVSEICLRFSELSVHPALDGSPLGARLCALVLRLGEGDEHAISSVLRCSPVEARFAPIRAFCERDPRPCMHEIAPLLALLPEGEFSASLARDAIARSSGEADLDDLVGLLPPGERDAQIERVAVLLWSRGTRLFEAPAGACDDGAWALLSLASVHRGLWPLVGGGLRRRAIDAMLCALSEVDPSGALDCLESNPLMSALGAIAGSFSAEEVLAFSPHAARLNHGAREALLAQAVRLLGGSGDVRMLPLLDGWARPPASCEGRSAYPGFRLAVALWRAQGSPDERLEAGLREAKLGGLEESVLENCPVLFELGLGAAALRRLLRSAPLRERFSILHSFWGRLRDDERPEFLPVLRLLARQCATRCRLDELEELGDWLGSDTARHVWRRELLVGQNPEWIMPLSLLRNACGEGAWSAWLDGAESVLAPR